ncbi:MAG: HigA family addiction module antidote protein [Alphaproteobacteria bacterium]|nr:HigA family addiction module antidote protein [Alphaproteobacteria bacterium]
MSMKHPAHPWEVLWHPYIEPREKTITEVASALGVTRKTLDAIVNCRADISTELAKRLSIAFDTTPELWLAMQR